MASGQSGSTGSIGTIFSNEIYTVVGPTGIDKLFPIILLEEGVSGDTVEYFHGSGEIVDIFSGLTPGEPYYWDYTTGVLTTDSSAVTPSAFIGIAVSSTEMIVRPDTCIEL